MTKFAFALLAAGTALASTSAASATTVIDFSALPLYTAVSSGPGVNISLYGGPGGGTAVTGSFGTPSLGNSPTGNYPTSQGVLFNFTSAVSNLSFTFNNFGSNDFGGQNSFAKSLAGATVTDLQNLSVGSCVSSFCTISMAGSGITQLFVDNGSNSNYSWEFGIGQISFDSAGVPEPASWALMIAGFGLVGAASRRRQSVRVTYA